MSFSSLIQIDTKPTQTEKKHAKSSRIEPTGVVSEHRSPENDRRGCDYCPLDKQEGINKVFGKVKGKKIFIWAQNPGPIENKEEKELIGPSGEFLWEELKRVGILRKHCDIQNVVRCWTKQKNPYALFPKYTTRAPSNQEIKCCSIYNEKAIRKSKAKLHLVFGAVAAKSLLQGEYKKDKRVFYSDRLHGWVIYLDHPSYFIRMGYGKGSDHPANDALKRFREDLNKAKTFLKGKSTVDRFGFLKSQKYIGITNTKLARRAYRRLIRKAKSGTRLVGDMESGRVNKDGEPDDNGRTVALCCGFSASLGTSYVFCLSRLPGVTISDRCLKLNLKLVRRLMRYADVKKAFHYGASDVDSVRNLLSTRVKGYDYDTLLGEYFDDPDGYAFGLDAVSQRYPDFSDYKDIIGPDSFTLEFQAIWAKQKGKKRWSLGQAVDAAKKKGMINLARLPWPRMILYNGADCHVTRLSMLRTKKVSNPSLMKAYIDSSFILYRMQKERDCQPLFDYKWFPKVNRLLTLQIKKARRKVCKLVGKKYIKLTKLKKNKETGEKEEVKVKLKFNPGSGDHIKWLLYTHLGYKFVGKTDRDKPNTKADTLERMALKHPKVKYILDLRRAKKAKSTYTKGYLASADKNEGHLATIWKQTGTSTGRLSSGKRKGEMDSGVVNLQNIHGDPLIKNLLISDPIWRKIYEHYKKFGAFTKKTWKKFKNAWVFFGSDFSQNELRQLAEESNDAELCRIFSSTEKWKCDKCGEMHSADPHCDVGHALTGWTKGTIYHDDRLRKFIKNMQFGLVYGLQGHGLYMFIIARGVKTTEDEVNKYHAEYFRRFKGVKVLQEKYRSFARKHGYVINQFGFRRKLKIEDDRDRNEGKKGPWWGNQAINTPIQGAAHQLLMFALAMLHISKKKYNLLKWPQLEIHDALYFRVRLKHLWRAIKQAAELLTKEPLRFVRKYFGFKKKVSLVAKPKAGLRFGVQVENIGEGKIKYEWQFLNEWCKENRKLEIDYKKQMRELQ